MRLRLKSIFGVLTGALIVTAIVGRPQAQGASESFSATATVKTAKATSTASVNITVTRLMSQAEADKFMTAFKTGGAAALRKALTGVAPVGSVKVGSDAATPARLSIERRTGGGRLITLVTDRPIRYVGGNAPGAKPKAGYDFGVVDLQVDDSGNGTGQIAPAAKVTVNEGAFVVSDYSAEVIRLAGVTRVKK
jgi:hypothetical protein